jgi:hypothetical protein
VAIESRKQLASLPSPPFPRAGSRSSAARSSSLHPSAAMPRAYSVCSATGGSHFHASEEKPADFNVMTDSQLQRMWIKVREGLNTGSRLLGFRNCKKLGAVHPLEMSALYSNLSFTVAMYAFLIQGEPVTAAEVRSLFEAPGDAAYLHSQVVNGVV